MSHVPRCNIKDVFHIDVEFWFISFCEADANPDADADFDTDVDFDTHVDLDFDADADLDSNADADFELIFSEASSMFLNLYFGREKMRGNDCPTGCTNL